MIGEKLPFELRWISSQQSSLMLLPRGLSKLWAGATSPDHARLLQLCEPISRLEIGSGHALVLEDGFHTSWWPTPNQGGGFLVRTLWSSHAEAVTDALRRIPENAWIPEMFEFDARDGTLGLFSAAEPAEAAADVLTFFVAPGTYKVLSANVEPDPGTCLIVHRLMPIH